MPTDCCCEQYGGLNDFVVTISCVFAALHPQPILSCQNYRGSVCNNSGHSATHRHPVLPCHVSSICKRLSAVLPHEILYWWAFCSRLIHLLLECPRRAIFVKQILSVKCDSSVKSSMILLIFQTWKPRDQLQSFMTNLRFATTLVWYSKGCGRVLYISKQSWKSPSKFPFTSLRYQVEVSLL